VKVLIFGATGPDTGTWLRELREYNNMSCLGHCSFIGEFHCITASECVKTKWPNFEYLEFVGMLLCVLLPNFKSYVLIQTSLMPASISAQPKLIIRSTVSAITV
jgi:hypothetical protein